MKMQILSYTIQVVVSDVCTEFQNPRPSSSWETFDTTFPDIGLRDGTKEKGEKNAK